MADRTGRVAMNSTANNQDLQSEVFSYEKWREDFLRVLLRGAVVVGLFVTIAAYLSTPGFLAVLYIAAYGTIVILTVVKLSYRVRAVSFVAVLLVVSLSNLLETGVRVDARLFLLTATLVAAMLFGTRAGLITAVIGVVLIGVTGILVLTEQYQLVNPLDKPGTWSNWLISTIVLITLETILLIGLNLLQRGFDQAQQQSQKLLQTVKVERQTLEQSVIKRTDQLYIAADVSQAVASILDPAELLSQVVNLIMERFGFYYVAVFTPDRSNTYLVLREATGEAGRALKERGHRLRITLDSMVGYAASKREPRVAQQAELDVTHPLLPNTRSEISLPLLAGDQLLGVLDVQAIQPNAFDESSIATLRNVAAQIAIALQNAQSYQRLQEALGYTTRQYELSRTIFTARTPGEAFQALGQVFAIVSDIDRISVLQVSERDETGLPVEYELVIEWDVLGGAQFDKGLRYAAAETPLVRLVNEGDATIIPDAQDVRLPLDTRQQLAKVGVQAAMLVPLMIRGRLEGFIAAVAERSHEFQDSEVRLMKSAAEQLGVVLSNLQLTTEMQTTLDRVALLNRRLSGETWKSYLTSREQWLVESGQAQTALTTAHLQVPIVIRGETIGIFNVTDARADRQWQEEELTMLQTIAGEVALAIENARLIEQTQHAAQRERDIATAADKIHRSINLEAILHTAVEEVMRIAGTTEVAIQLGRAETQPDNGQPVLAS